MDGRTRTGRLRDVCLSSPHHADGSGAVRIELSGEASAVVERISKGTALGAFVVVTAAVCLLAHRYTARPSVVLDIPRAVAEPTPCSTATGVVAVTLALEGLDTLKDLLVELQREIARAHGSIARHEHEPDVLVIPASMAELARPSPRHDLCVGVGRTTVELDSPSERLPQWMLTDIGRQLDGIVASLAELRRPLATFEDVVRRHCLAQVVAFNRTARPIPPGETVLDPLAAHVRARPDAVAVVCGARSLTYRALAREASALAARIRTRLGDVRGRVVASLDARSERAIVSLLGILETGAVYLPLNRKAPPTALRRMLEESSAVGVVGCPQLLERAHEPIGRRPCVVVDVPDREPPGDEHRALPGPRPEDSAYIIYTSGTTGVSKGVELAHVGLLNTALEHVDRLRVTPEDRYLQFMALSFDGFLLDVFTTLCAGATLIMADDDAIADPSRLTDVIEEHGVTISTITPSYLRLLDAERLASLRVLVSAGEVLGPELARSLAGRLELYNGYGPTEATINSTLHRVDPERCAPPIPIGRPSANKQIYVVDERLELQPIGVVGELCIAGVGLARGYVGDPALTRAKLVDNPFGAGRLYRTGDYGAWGPDGALSFLGRADGQVKLRGHRIDLLEIQAALAAHADVRSAEVLVRHAGHHDELLAFYQPRTSARPPQASALRLHLARCVPEYMQPHHLVAVDPWPLTPHGKTDASALLAWWSSGRSPHDAQEPATTTSPTERVLSEIWSAVLGVAQPGVDQSFFSLGGDSIRLIEVVHQARRRGLALEARDVIEQRTIGRLAALLEARVHPADDTDSVPLHLAEPSPAERSVVPPGVEDAYPAALMQTFMIEGYARDHERNGIHLGYAEWRFHDPSLSERAMIEAIQRLCDRHRSLRLSFVRASTGRDLLLVLPPRSVPVPRSDLRGRSSTEQEAWVWAELERHDAERFDPYARAPLIRFHLCRTSDEGCSLLVCFHHALLDGWSGIELRNALLEHYLDAKAGRPAPPASPRADSYREFVALERAVLEDPAARKYWEAEVTSPVARAALEGFRRALWSRRRGPAAHATTQVELPSALVRDAIAHSTRSGTSVKALMLAGVAQTVMEALDLDHLVLGAITNGRSSRLTEPLRSTGLFWNIVPLSISAAQAASVAVVQQRLDALTPYGHFPWKAIEDDLAREELLVPMFNFVNFHNTAAGARRLTEGVVQSRFHTPLTFFIKLDEANSDGSALLRLGYDRSIFGQADAEAMSQRVCDSISTMARTTS